MSTKEKSLYEQLVYQASNPPTRLFDIKTPYGSTTIEATDRWDASINGLLEILGTTRGEALIYAHGDFSRTRGFWPRRKWVSYDVGLRGLDSVTVWSSEVPQ